MFLELGYPASSVDRIARRAQASKATLYSLYPDKESLFAAVVDTVVARQQPDTTFLDHGTDPGQALRAFAHGLIDALTVEESLALFRLVVAESGRHPELGRTLFRRITGAGAGALAEYLRSQTEQRILAVADPRRAALQLLGSVKEVLFWPRLLGLDVTDSPNAVIDDAVHFFLVARTDSTLSPGTSLPVRRIERG